MSLPRNLFSPALHRIRRLIEHVGEIAPGTRIGAGFGTLGEASCIGYPQATIFGTRAVHIGAETLIGRHCTLTVGYGDEPEAELPERGLVIGERCVMGAFSTLTAHESIEIEDDVWFGQGVFVSDASHGYQDVETPIGRQLGSHDPVRVGRGSWVGHRAVLLPGVQLGRHCVVAAGAVVRGAVPDHTVVAGVPARVVRQWVPGTGWVGAKGDVRPAYRAEEIARMLSGDAPPAAP